MPRLAFLFILIIFSLARSSGEPTGFVVANSLTHAPLRGAVIFDRTGRQIATSRKDGSVPSQNAENYPLTVKYLGHRTRRVTTAMTDTVFLDEDALLLPEVVVESRQRKLLHMIAYVREYSTLSTLTDTVRLFREKMVDFMIPTERAMKFEGWTAPRVLKAASYYRFTNFWGLDSVSDGFNFHFSWADWVGVAPTRQIPTSLQTGKVTTDTIKGRYGKAETWRREGEGLYSVDIDVLADTSARRWVPDLAHFFREGIDFDKFLVHYDYNNVFGGEATPFDLSGFRFTIESNNRGRRMNLVGTNEERFYITTDAEVYIIESEYISAKEAEAWQTQKHISESISLFEPAEAPVLSSEVLSLVDRVRAIDHDSIRLGVRTDPRLFHPKVKLNVGQRILSRIKGLVGLDQLNGERKQKNKWKNFRDKQRSRNSNRKD